MTRWSQLQNGAPAETEGRREYTIMTRWSQLQN